MDVFRVTGFGCSMCCESCCQTFTYREYLPASAYCKTLLDSSAKQLPVPYNPDLRAFRLSNGQRTISEKKPKYRLTTLNFQTPTSYSVWSTYLLSNSILQIRNGKSPLVRETEIRELTMQHPSVRLYLRSNSNLTHCKPDINLSHCKPAIV